MISLFQTLNFNINNLNCSYASAGVGRTGTFIAVDTIAQKLQHSGAINIYETVMELRQHRINMVQTEVKFIKNFSLSVSFDCYLMFKFVIYL